MKGKKISKETQRWRQDELNETRQTSEGAYYLRSDDEDKENERWRKCGNGD